MGAENFLNSAPKLSPKTEHAQPERFGILGFKYSGKKKMVWQAEIQTGGGQLLAKVELSHPGVCHQCIE